MDIQQIETLIARNLTITDQRLMDGVVGAVMDAVEAEREACAQACDAIANDLEARGFGFESSGADDCAAAIRARSEA